MEPQGIAYVPSPDKVFIANAGDGTVSIRDGHDFSQIKEIALGDDADNIRLDGPDLVIIGSAKRNGSLRFVKRLRSLIYTPVLRKCRAAIDGLHEFLGKETGTADEKMSETFRALVHSVIIHEVRPKAPLKVEIFGKLSVLLGEPVCKLVVAGACNHLNLRFLRAAA